MTAPTTPRSLDPVTLPPARVVTLALRGRPVVRARIAARWWQRARGLLFAPALLPAEGLLITPCGSVHTWGMRTSIDVVYLDAALRVLKICAQVRPWRFSYGGRRARHTLELAAGECARIGLAAGDVLAPAGRFAAPSQDEGPQEEGGAA